MVKGAEQGKFLVYHIRNVSLSAENRQHSSPVLHCYSTALSWQNARLFVYVSVLGYVRKYEF